MEVWNSQKRQLAKVLSRSMEEIEKLVGHHPTLLRSNVNETIAPKVKLVQKRLGFSRKEAGRVCSTSPTARLLTTSTDLLETKIDWIMRELELSKRQMRLLVKSSHGSILTMSLESNLKPKVELLRAFLHLDNKQLFQVLKSRYTYKRITPEFMRRRLSLLREIFDIDETDIPSLRKYVMRFGSLLFRPEETIVRRYDWWQERLKSSRYATAHVMRSQPQLLSLSPEYVENTVDWLQKALGLTDDDVAILLPKFPTLLTYSVEDRLEPKLRYLRERFELNNERLKDLLLRMPGLFSYSDEKIEQKLQFYSTLVGEVEAKKIVIESPNLIVTASLENRLQPRLAEIERSGEKVQWDRTLIQRLARRTDDVWGKYGIGDATRRG